MQIDQANTLHTGCPSYQRFFLFTINVGLNRPKKILHFQCNYLFTFRRVYRHLISCTLYRTAPLNTLNLFSIDHLQPITVIKSVSV